jgi:subtilisin family serine protease
MKHKKLFHFSFLTITCLLIALLSTPARTDASLALLSNVDRVVIEKISSEGESEFLVLLSEQADLIGALQLAAKEEKGRYVFERLTETSVRSQASLIEELDNLGVEYKSYWITNMILVRGGATVLLEVAGQSEVEHIYANPQIRFDAPVNNERLLSPVQDLEWNIKAIQADLAWSQGITGQGVVIGGQDTGYKWDHPALINQYRGWDGTTADHNFNWHDAIHSGPNTICAPDSTEPCDDLDHGTHTMGIAVGDGGPGNQIGVAPGAQWIGCRNMDLGVGTPASYIECYQWFLAPTDLNGQNPDPQLAPDIINNSWSCPPIEDCTNPEVLRFVVENVRSAGILTVQSAGNSGPSCESINTPAAIYDASFTVGATAQDGSIANFSSRGPVTVDGSNRIKPDITAPGESINSSTKNGGYGIKSGTSMAAPHVAGMAALFISADPCLRGLPNKIEETIITLAIPKAAQESCGQLPGSSIPNNTFGYGIVNGSGITSLECYQNFTPFISTP